jgi:hypothetical protein
MYMIIFPTELFTCYIGFEILHSGGYEEFCLLAYNAKQVASRTASCWFLALLILQPRRWRQHFPSEHWLTFHRLRDVMSQKVEFFIHLLVHTYLTL